MMKKELSYFVNLNEFPIHDSDNSKYKKIVQEAREALSLDGCYVLKSIINMEAIYEMQKEASKIENLAHYTTNKVNVYFSKDDASYPKDHPRRFFMERSNGFVSGDKFPKNSMIKELVPEPSGVHSEVKLTTIDKYFEVIWKHFF